MTFGKYTAAVVAVYAIFVLPAQAAPVTQCGPTICYSYDDAQAATALFGSPTLVGDALVFLPPSFRAESLNGAGTDIVSANFIFDEVYSVSGADIANFTVFESGDYEMIGGDEVGADILLTVVSNAPNPDFPPIPENGTSLASFVATGDSGGQQEWDLLNSYNLYDDFSLPTNSLQLSLQNTLTAIAGDPTDSAWIQKKLTLTAAAVPVPAAVWLFGSALGAMGWLRRRKSAV